MRGADIFDLTIPIEFEGMNLKVRGFCEESIWKKQTVGRRELEYFLKHRLKVLSCQRQVPRYFNELDRQLTDEGYYRSERASLASIDTLLASEHFHFRLANEV